MCCRTGQVASLKRQLELNVFVVLAVVVCEMLTVRHNVLSHWPGGVTEAAARVLSDAGQRTAASQC